MQGAGQSRSWVYHIDWYKDPAMMDSIVMVRSKHRDRAADNNLQISSWTNYDSSSISISPSSPPLILYTQVHTMLVISVPCIPTLPRCPWVTEEWPVQGSVSPSRSAAQMGQKLC